MHDRCAELKTLPDGTHLLVGYAVVWGGADLEGDTFPPDVDLGESLYEPHTWPLLYEHGQHPQIGAKSLGRVIKAERDDIGLLIEAEIARSEEYIELLRRLAREGRLGLSTGAVAHLVERNGKTITRWPIAEVSATPTPAEPRTLGADFVKALFAQDDKLEQQEAASGEPVEAADVSAAEDVAAQAQAADASVSDSSEVKPMFLTDTNAQDERVTIVDYVKSAVSYKLHGKPYKNVQVTPGTQGGFLIPQQFVPELIQFRGILANVFDLCMRITPSGAPVVIPALDMDTTPTDGAAYYGGAVATIVGENTALSATAPAYKQVTLTPRTLGVFARASWLITQLESPDLTIRSAVLTPMQRALEWAIERYVINGSGVGQPVGVINAANTGRYLESRATASTITLADVTEMYARQLNPQNAVWIASPSTLPALLAMAASNVIAWNRDLTQGPPALLLGRPLYFSSAMPTLGSAGDIAFVDFSQYALVMSDQVAIDVDTSAGFASAQIAFRILAAFDGRPTVDAIVPYPSGTFDQSFYVVLGA